MKTGLTVKQKGVIGVIIIGIAFIFFILGIMTALYGVGDIVSKIHINKISVELNQTQMIDYMVELKNQGKIR